MKNINKSPLESLLAEITPLEQAKTDAKMILAARIADGIKSKKWKNRDFLAAVGKENPSIITKWLSGTHNFTVDTLIEIEAALDISLLKWKESEKESIVTYQLTVTKEVDLSSGLDYFNQIIVAEGNNNQQLYKGFCEDPLITQS